MNSTNKGRETMDETGDVLGVECFCYFRGRDGMGACNIECQWSTPIKFGKACPMWTPKEQWNSDQDFAKGTIEEYEKATGKTVIFPGPKT